MYGLPVLRIIVILLHILCLLPPGIFTCIAGVAADVVQHILPQLVGGGLGLGVGRHRIGLCRTVLRSDCISLRRRQIDLLAAGRAYADCALQGNRRLQRRQIRAVGQGDGNRAGGSRHLR